MSSKSWNNGTDSEPRKYDLFLLHKASRLEYYLSYLKRYGYTNHLQVDIHTFTLKLSVPRPHWR